MALTDIYPMPTTSLYWQTDEGQEGVQNEIIPIVLGDLTEVAATNGFLVNKLPKVPRDAGNQWLLACHNLLDDPLGGQKAFYEEDWTPYTDYTITNTTDYTSQGYDVAYVEIAGADPVLYGIYKGAIDEDGNLITNPVSALEWLLDFFENKLSIPPRNPTSFAKAKQVCDTNGYTIAGLLLADRTPAEWLSEILACFGGSWWLNREGEIIIRIEDTTSTWYDLAGILSEHKSASIRGRQTLKHLCNQLHVNYAVSYSAIDRRFKTTINTAYYVTDDGESTKDTASQARYGLRTRFLDFNWTQSATTVNTVQDFLVATYKDPIWIIDWEEEGFGNIQVEKGDFVLYSWEHRKDDNGLPLRNQVAQVMEKEVDFDSFRIRFILRDTGYPWPLEPELCDGRIVAGDGTYLGGERDRRILA